MMRGSGQKVEEEEEEEEAKFECMARPQPLHFWCLRFEPNSMTSNELVNMTRRTTIAFIDNSKSLAKRFVLLMQ